MPPIRGIVVCVNYDDLLSITLPRNIHLLEEVLVVTHPDDHKTKALAKSIDRVRLFETDAFYRNGAKFNKGLAMEEGFDVLGREGWIVVWDADTLFPGNMMEHLTRIEIGRLYSPNRRMLVDVTQWNDAIDWKTLPLQHPLEFCGYFQLFHASDPVLVSRRPWYGVKWTHAGRCDCDFQNLWSPAKKTRPKCEVLHLGPHDENWFGRVSDRVDGEEIDERDSRHALMTSLKRKHGWGGHKRTRENLVETVDHA